MIAQKEFQSAQAEKTNEHLAEILGIGVTSEEGDVFTQHEALLSKEIPFQGDHHFRVIQDTSQPHYTACLIFDESRDRVMALLQNAEWRWMLKEFPGVEEEDIEPRKKQGFGLPLSLQLKNPDARIFIFVPKGVWCEQNHPALFLEIGTDKDGEELPRSVPRSLALAAYERRGDTDRVIQPGILRQERIGLTIGA